MIAHSKNRTALCAPHYPFPLCLYHNFHHASYHDRQISTQKVKRNLDQKLELVLENEIQNKSGTFIVCYAEATPVSKDVCFECYPDHICMCTIFNFTT